MIYSIIATLIGAEAVGIEITNVCTSLGSKVTLVANQSMYVPPSELFSTVLVPDGANIADQRIVELLSAGDLVITADIPLAARSVKAGATTIAPNGKPFDEHSIGMTLATRNLMADLRSAGETTRGPKPFSPRDRSAFLSALDQAIVRLTRDGFGQSGVS